jgi:mannan endo-1,4-beta-mannosidase
MSRLVADYGRHSWSALKLTNDMAQIFTNTAKTPLIISGDFMDYSPSRVAKGANPKDHVEKMIALHQGGHVNAMDWHWGAPTNSPGTATQRSAGSFMSKDSRFDLAAALANTNSPEYGLLLRDLDAIGMQLKKFSDAKVAVLWRPLHEADGKWFWWGAQGPAPCKELWRLMFARFTARLGLHNLIWVYTPANPTRDEWYPGDDVVDIIGLDAYPKDPADILVSKWQELQARYDGKKLLALTEFGGVPDIEAMQAAGVWWAYFSSWNHTLDKSPRETLMRTYRSPRVATLESFRAAGTSGTGTSAGGSHKQVLNR